MENINQERIQEAYSLFAKMLVETAEDTDGSSDYNEMDELLGTAERLSILLKRLKDIYLLG